MVSMIEVKALLDPDEPDYSKIEELGADAVDHLRALTDSGDEMLASKAAYAASLLAEDLGADLVERAAASDIEAVRVAAAAGLRNLGAERASKLAVTLAADADEGVSSTARLSASAHESGEVADALGLTGDQTPPEAETIMPESPPGRDSSPETGGSMPGDPRDDTADMPTGMMPGETPESSSSDGSGLMPGETAATDAPEDEAMPDDGT